MTVLGLALKLFVLYMQLKDAALELDGKPAIYALSKTKT